MTLGEQVAGSDDLERVAALRGIARIVIDVRLIAMSVVAAWLLSVPEHRPLAVLVALGGVWMLVALLRWETFGVVLTTHPLLLFLDVLACLLLLFVVQPVSPALLLLGSGAVLIGVCLGERGAAVLGALMVVGWTVIATRPEVSASVGAVVLWAVIPGLLLGCLVLGVGVRRVVLTADELERDRRRQIRLLGVAEERARLAREMHDSLVKSLHGVTMMVQSLPAWIDREPEKAKAQARVVAEEVSRAAAGSRALVLAMRRANATGDLADQVRRAVQRWEAGTARTADLDLEPEAAVAVESAYELVAILDELLENIRKHTPPETPVRVELRTQPGWVELVVADEGPGLPDGVSAEELQRTGHFGLLGMEERAHRVGGRLATSSTPGRGLTTSVMVPQALAEEEI